MSASGSAVAGVSRMSKSRKCSVMSPSVKLFAFHAAYSGLCRTVRLSMEMKTRFPAGVCVKRMESPR